MTEDTALRTCRKLWIWMYQNPDLAKWEWPGWNDTGTMKNDCPCCEYAGGHPRRTFETNCAECPLMGFAWAVDSGTMDPWYACENFRSPYLGWSNSENEDDCQLYALEIIRACETALGSESPEPFQP